MSPATLAPSPQLGALLPEDARGPLDVYVDGIELREGQDYVALPGAIALKVPVAPRKESRWRDVVTTVVGIGFYRQGDYVDVRYGGADGRSVAATLPVTRISAPAATLA